MLVPNTTDTLQIEAVTDQSLQYSVHANRVQPAQLVNQPQTHWMKLRLEKEYSIENKGHYVKGGV